MRRCIKESPEQLTVEDADSYATQWTIAKIFSGPPNPRTLKLIIIVSAGKTSQRDKGTLQKFPCKRSAKVREEEPIRLASNRLGEDTQWLEGWGASRSPQPVAQQHARDTAAMWKSCGRELEAPEVSGANKKIPWNTLRGKKGCSAMK